MNIAWESKVIFYYRVLKKKFWVLQVNASIPFKRVQSLCRRVYRKQEMNEAKEYPQKNSGFLKQSNASGNRNHFFSWSIKVIDLLYLLH